MADIIRLLPDSVANQIAAGEVVQRPASAVKELLENSIDAGASSVKLLVKDAGKTLIQVIDNGSGMSETDARLCFERHATSKIKKAEDLFSIKTMGFRGEAMASIAAIAQVEMKTRRQGSELGTLIEIEGSEVRKQEPVQCTEGTSIAIKNLFFNVPARRNFLKSNPAEMRYIIEEFQRVAMPYPEKSFSLIHDDKEIFRLESGNLRQRISGALGSNMNEKLVPVEETTDIVKIKGYVGKPEFTKKGRGEQYFFVNNRYIKNSYLHHAVMAAFEEFIPPGTFPAYFLFLEVDPSTIDINIHPTKTEIKFEDERAVYAIIRSAVRQALGKFHLTPSLDFEQENVFTLPLDYKNKDAVMPSVQVNPDFNPFEEEKKQSNQASGFRSNQPKINLGNWEQLYSKDFSDFSTPSHHSEQEKPQLFHSEAENSGTGQAKFFHLLNKTYILTTLNSSIIFIHLQRARERVMYERFLAALEKNPQPTCRVLFPVTLEVSPSDAELLKELFPELNKAGFDIAEFGQNTFVINGLPAGVNETEAKEVIEGALEHFKANAMELKLEKKVNICRSMSKRIASRATKTPSDTEMRSLTEELFSCVNPHSSPGGKTVVFTVTPEDLEQKFN
jgi:DNA mismatch repair protein MutL